MAKPRRRYTKAEQTARKAERIAEWKNTCAMMAGFAASEYRQDMAIKACDDELARTIHNDNLAPFI